MRATLASLSEGLLVQKKRFGRLPRNMHALYGQFDHVRSGLVHVKHLHPVNNGCVDRSNREAFAGYRRRKTETRI